MYGLSSLSDVSCRVFTMATHVRCVWVVHMMDVYLKCLFGMCCQKEHEESCWGETPFLVTY